MDRYRYIRQSLLPNPNGSWEQLAALILLLRQWAEKKDRVIPRIWRKPQTARIRFLDPGAKFTENTAMKIALPLKEMTLSEKSKSWRKFGPICRA